MTGEIDSKLDVGRSAAVYEVLPDKVYKGRVTIPVFAISETGGRCGYPFVAGKRYLIYASIKAERRYLSASICGLTGQAKYKSFDLTVLDRVASQSSVLCTKEASAERRRQIFFDRHQKPRPPTLTSTEREPL